MEQGYSLRNTTEARVIIAELLGNVKSKNLKLEQMKKEMQKLEEFISFKDHTIGGANEEKQRVQKLADFYEKMTFSLIDSSGMFVGKKKKKEMDTFASLKAKLKEKNNSASNRVSVMEELIKMKPLEQVQASTQKKLEAIKESLNELQEVLVINRLLNPQLI